jgi:F-type H+-transporting ATPase subunit gamma
MAGAREFKRRIRSVQSTEQITKAMKMVAASKLRRCQTRAEESRPYTETLQNTLADLASVTTEAKHPLLVVRENVKKVLYVVVTGDRGLCGAYNTNLIKAASDAIKSDERDVESGVVAVGRRASDFFKKRGGLVADWTGLSDYVNYSDAKEIADYIMEAYANEQVDEVYLVYARFVNALRQIPTVSRLLPVATPQVEKQETERREEYIYEPSAQAILGSLIPRYVGSQVYHAMLEGKASEQGARMTAMSNATENAAEIVHNLTIEMNKERQAAITSELIDIVGGSEALSK